MMEYSLENHERLVNEVRFKQLYIQNQILEGKAAANDRQKEKYDHCKEAIKTMSDPNMDKVVRAYAIPLYKKEAAHDADSAQYVDAWPEAISPDLEGAEAPEIDNEGEGGGVAVGPEGEFRPTPSQRRLINALVSNPTILTVNEVCILANVHPSSYYRWLQDPVFRQFFTNLWAQNVIMGNFQLMNLARNRAQAGIHAYVKLMWNLTLTIPGQQAFSAWKKSVIDDDGLPAWAHGKKPSPSVDARHLHKTVEDVRSTLRREDPSNPLARPPKQKPSAKVETEPKSPDPFSDPAQQSQSVTGENERESPIQNAPPAEAEVPSKPPETVPEDPPKRLEPLVSHVRGRL